MTAALSPWLGFPAIVGGALAAAIALQPLCGAPMAFTIAKLAALVAIAFGERWLPYREDWSRSHGDVATDIAHGLISGIGTTALLRVAVQAGGIALGGALSRAVGATIWPSTWPLPAQLALAAVVSELPQYWVHRWQHEHDLLWRYHSVHHSVSRLYWLNGARNHPVDLGMNYLVGYLPLIALGASEPVIMLFTLFDPLLGTIQHSNIALRLGPLNYLFSACEPHRWHHSRSQVEAKSNYGSNLLVWDVVFGTFYLPPGRAPLAVGIADMPDFPRSFVAQLAAPFRWHRLRRSSAQPGLTGARRSA